jgi:hypothetical protein
MSPSGRTIRLVELSLGGDASGWERIGFTVHGGAVSLGQTMLRLSGGGGGIDGWTLAGVAAASLDGLPTRPAPEPWRAPDPPDGDHPNGALRIDHVVVRTPSLDRTIAALDDAGLDLRRTRDAGSGVRQGFLWVGETILELVETPGGDPEAPAAFWGLVVVVADLGRAAAVAGDRLGAVRDAVQPGRRIATVRADAGVGIPLALMTPHVRRTA